MLRRYAGAVPAHLVLACGVFGNVPIADIEATIRFLPALCAPGAWVLWTRHPSDKRIVRSIRKWLAGAGFEDVEVVVPDGGAFGSFGVGAARLVTPPTPFEPGRRLFTFTR